MALVAGTNPDRGTLTATIADNGTTSDAITLAGCVPVGILVPAGWVTADVTFLASVDGTNYYVLGFDNNGVYGAVTITGVVAERLVALDPVKMLPAPFLKVVASASQTGGPIALTVVVRPV